MAKNNTKTAIALGKSTSAEAIPQVLATGKGDLAQRILDWADENDLAIEKNSDLAQVLINLDLGDSVPEEVFMAVAEILYYVFEVNNAQKEKENAV